MNVFDTFEQINLFLLINLLNNLQWINKIGQFKNAELKFDGFANVFKTGISTIFLLLPEKKRFSHYSIIYNAIYSQLLYNLKMKQKL